MGKVYRARTPRPRLRQSSCGVSGSRAATIAAMVILTSASCAARRRVVAPAAPAIEDTRQGKTSVRVLNPPEIQPGAEPPSERITPAFASDENKLPEYPAYALKAGCREGAVPVRVHIGTDGNVAAQRDVPGRPLPNDPCHVAFRAAVQGAVKDWRFAPAFREQRTPGPDIDKDGKPDFDRWVQQGPVAIYLDFEFLFRVIGGKGEVRTR